MSSSASSSATSPEATPEATGFHYSYYLSAFPPTWDTLQKGLAFFAVLIILRSCLIRLRVWASSLKDRAAAASSSAAPVPKPPPPSTTTTTTSSTTSTKDRRRQNKDNNGFQDNLPQPSLQHNHGPSPTYTTTINHFRPYINQRYPSSIPPWLKEPPKFGMDEGRGLVNPLETGDGSLVPAGLLLDADDGDAPPDVLKTPPPPLTGDQHWNRVGTGPLRHLLARPPPAPPLTPPELSNSIFTLGGRAHNHESFIHQPNPDYASASSSTPSSSSPQARRYSYTKTIPIGVPIPRQQQPSSSSAAAAAAAAAAAGDDIVQGADLTFSPSSFPPTSPLLPPAPPVVPRSLGGADEPEPAAVASAAAAERSGRREIDLKGQVVSVLDQDGAGWKRHTRVYGGGVCLACKAAGQEHGAGGFYGATVSPEEMR